METSKPNRRLLTTGFLLLVSLAWFSSFVQALTSESPHQASSSAAIAFACAGAAIVAWFGKDVPRRWEHVRRMLLVLSLLAIVSLLYPLSQAAFGSA